LIREEELKSKLPTKQRFHSRPEIPKALKNWRKVMNAEELAKFFHDTYEELAPNYGYTTRKSSAEPWSDVPEPNKSLMIAVAEKVLEKLKLEAGITWSDGDQ
jgi:hypothetical protein